MKIINETEADSQGCLMIDPQAQTSTAYVVSTRALKAVLDQSSHGNAKKRGMAERIHYAVTSVVTQALRAESNWQYLKAWRGAKSKGNPRWNEGMRIRNFYLTHPRETTAAEGGASRPVELWSRETAEFFGYSYGSDSVKAVAKILQWGVTLGLWRYYPIESETGCSGKKHECQPARLILLGRWWRDVPCRVGLTSICLCRQLSGLPLSPPGDDSKLRELERRHAQFMERATPPTREEMAAEARRLVGNEFRTKKSELLYRYDALGRGGDGPNLHDDILRHERARLAPVVYGTGWVVDESDRRKYLRRRYTVWTMCPKWIRQLYRVDGEPLVSLDAKALHPNILYRELARLMERTGTPKLMRKAKLPDFLTEDSHAKVGKLLGLSREEGKSINLYYWNAPKGDYGKFPKHTRGLLERFHGLMQGGYPHVLEGVRMLNERMGLLNTDGSEIEEHARLFRRMEDREVYLMDTLLKGFPADRPIVTCHDAVYVRASDRVMAMDHFRSCLKFCKLRTWPVSDHPSATVSIGEVPDESEETDDGLESSDDGEDEDGAGETGESLA